MQGSAQNRMRWGTLKSIVALLFSLAAIAQRTSNAPLPVRFLVLSILRRAEPVAYSFVYWTARDCGAPLFWYSPMTGQKGSAPEDLLDLAAWFRVLAVALRDLPRRARHASRRRVHWSYDLAGALRRIGRPVSANLQASGLCDRAWQARPPPCAS